MATYEIVKKRLEAKRGALAEAIASPHGQTILKSLEGAFFEGAMLGKTSEETMFNIGAREVVVYLRSLRLNEGEKTDG